jgi:hypothetical protein
VAVDWPGSVGGAMTRPEAVSHTVTTLPAGEPGGTGTSPVRTRAPGLSHRARAHTWPPP